MFRIYLAGGAGELRSKTKVHDTSEEDLLTEDASVFPDWNYDGSSTAQADGTDSEVILKPRASFVDPFRGSPHRLVMCDTYRPDDTPLESNHRAKAVELFSVNSESNPGMDLNKSTF